MKFYGSFDVIVCGGGTAGVSAAICAARRGAKTLLVERLGVLGGQMTASGPPGFAYANIFNDHGEQIIDGFLGETHARLLADGHAMPLPPPGERTARSFAFIDPDWWGFLIFDLVQEAGVRLLLHTLVVDVVKEGDRIRGVIVENPSGRQTILGAVIIDCTGEGEVAARAGVPFETVAKDDPYPFEPPSIAFAMDGVDWDAVLAYAKAHPEEMAVISHGIDTPPAVIEKKTRQIRDMQHGSELVVLGQLAFDALTRELVASGEHHPYGDIGFFFTPREGGAMQATFQHSAQVLNVDCTDADQLTAAEIEARRQAAITLRAARKHLPGFQHAYLSKISTELRIRETRRIRGDYQLVWGDADGGRKFPDVIGKSAMTVGSRHVATIDTLATYPCGRAHPPEGGSFDIPYRICVPLAVEGMLVAGKMVSTTRECALRFLPETMETGQAAGVAAALCAERGITPRELEANVGELQAVLAAQGVILYGTH